MYLKFAHILTALTAIALSSLKAYAVPAYPYPMQVHQPDGTTVTLRLTGDEFGSRTETLDGYTVIDTPQGWVYATEKGATTITAHDADKRGETERKFLGEIKRGMNIRPVKVGNRRKTVRRRNTAFLGPSHVGEADKLVEGNYPVTGEVHTLVILVEFSDYSFVTPEVHDTFDRELNMPGFDEREHIGSATDYFRTQSGGAFDPHFDLYGPVRVSRSVNYYGENDLYGYDMHADEMVIEACAALDGEVDFSRYDLDGDGCVDNVYIFYAGYGENFSGAKSTLIWPHAYYIGETWKDDETRTFDGVKIDSYGCCAELYGISGRDTASIGTFCHEFGHILGLPDTYDTNYSEDGTGYHPESWDVMANGCYLPNTRNSGAVPASYSGIERYLLGWGDPVDICEPSSVRLRPLCMNGEFLRISTSYPDEYYILENRQNIEGTYDRYLPSHGMLVWHIDRREDEYVRVTIEGESEMHSCKELWSLEYNAVNCNADMQCLEIVKAYGGGTRRSADTPFPGRGSVTSWTDDTSPSMISRRGERLAKPLTEIREEGDDVLFDFMGGGEYFETTGISGNEARESADSDKYGLSGNRVSEYFRGVVISHGRKEIRR